jgi:hypothetical protein
VRALGVQLLHVIRGVCLLLQNLETQIAATLGHDGTIKVCVGIFIAKTFKK